MTGGRGVMRCGGAEVCDRKVKWVDQSLACLGVGKWGEIGNAGPGVMKWNLLVHRLVVVGVDWRHKERSVVVMVVERSLSRSWGGRRLPKHRVMFVK